MVNLLESAGFSRANPYYVVQQGKVCRLPVCQQGALHEAGGLHWMLVWPAVRVQKRAWPICRVGKPYEALSCGLADACWVQITAMASMKDPERLELLKEIGGTKVCSGALAWPQQ